MYVHADTSLGPSLLCFDLRRYIRIYTLTSHHSHVYNTNPSWFELSCDTTPAIHNNKPWLGLLHSTTPLLSVTLVHFTLHCHPSQGWGQGRQSRGGGKWWWDSVRGEHWRGGTCRCFTLFSAYRFSQNAQVVALCVHLCRLQQLYVHVCCVLLPNPCLHVYISCCLLLCIFMAHDSRTPNLACEQGMLFSSHVLSRFLNFWEGRGKINYIPQNTNKEKERKEQRWESQWDNKETV